MGKKNGSKKRDKRNLLKRTDELATVFKRVEFNEDHRWYNEAEEDGEFVKVRMNNNLIIRIIKYCLGRGQHQLLQPQP